MGKNKLHSSLYIPICGILVVCDLNCSQAKSLTFIISGKRTFYKRASNFPQLLILNSMTLYPQSKVVSSPSFPGIPTPDYDSTPERSPRTSYRWERFSCLKNILDNAVAKNCLKIMNEKKISKWLPGLASVGKTYFPEKIKYPPLVMWKMGLRIQVFKNC